MNLTTHSVVPEEVMAYLDGELSSAEARTVAVHFDECTECANLAAQFRATSQSLSSWTVPTIPSTLEEAINGSAAKSASNRKSSKPTPHIRFSLSNWKLWAVVGGGALAGILVFIVAIQSLSYYSDHVRTRRSMAFVRPKTANETRSGDSF